MQLALRSVKRFEHLLPFALCIGLFLNDGRDTCYDTLEFFYGGHAGVLDSPPDCNGENIVKIRLAVLQQQRRGSYFIPNLHVIPARSIYGQHYD